ncbi:MAG: lamin tail domain-containing protein [Flavobacteriales bacterium]
MKGTMVRFFATASMIWLAGGTSLTSSAQDLVINEVNLIVGPNYSQFVELYGEPGTPLNGHSLVVVKSSFLSGEWTALTQAVVDLEGQTLDSDGYLALYGEGWQNTISAVVLTNTPAAELEVNAAPALGEILDAVFCGGYFLTSPQWQAIVEAVSPGAEIGVVEGGTGFNAGTDGLSRVPDGGSPLDQGFVMQALSPGTSNVLPCEGGHLAANNPNVSTYCTDVGPVLVGFTHQSDAASAATSLAVVDAATSEVVATYLGTSINMEGLGDGTYEVYAISHNQILSTGWTSLDSISTTPEGGCVSVSDQPVVLLGETCEIPSCDGGTLLTAGGEPDAEACLTEDGALVSFGYYSDAVEGDYVFLICDEDDGILATTDEPYFDFAAFGEAGNYHVWGLSYQEDLDSTTVVEGASAFGASALGCDSLSSNTLLVNILQCGTAGLCDDLIISEYVEGTSNNKALEVHNPTPFDVDLTPYVMEVYNNGSEVPIQTLDLEGVLPSGGVHVMGNPQASAEIVNVSQVLSTVTWFNGNDPIVLRKNGEIIDMMGVIGEDPLGAWPVGEGAMAEFTLVRKPNIGQGSTNWNEGATQWDVYPQDTFDFLGDHTASCGGLGTMVVGFAAPELYVAEGSGVTVEMLVSYPLEDVEVQISVTGGDAAPGADFPAVFPLSFDFDEGLLNSQSFTFAAVDDEDPELQEDVEFTMTVTSGGAVLGIETVVVHILPSDLTYPVYDIIQVRGTTNQGVLDSIDTACELRGIVHGWNDYPQGLRFTLIDETHGINVFSAINNFGYEVQEGDSVRVRGVVGQFAGLATLYADTLIYEGSGFATQVPIQVQEMGEETESRVVKLKCVKLIDPAQWTNNFPYFDVMVDYGVGDVQIRIDGNTDIWGTEAPLGTFGVTGIGGQSDGTVPLFDGYTLLPRSLDDLTDPVQSIFSVPDVLVLGGPPVFAENQSLNADYYQWSFGNGTFSNEEEPELNYAEPGTYNVYLTATDAETQCSDQSSTTLVVESEDAVLEAAEWRATVYPNPASDAVRVACPESVHFEFLNALGQTMLKGQWPAGDRLVDVTSWPATTYTLRLIPLRDGAATRTARFAVQRR